MSFAGSIATFAEKTKGKQDVIVRKLAFDGLRGVVLRSPVDTGRFRGNWNLGVERPDFTARGGIVATAKDGTPQRNLSQRSRSRRGNVATAEGLQRGQEKLAAVNRHSKVYITNNLPYAIPLERGHSKQAPGPGGILAATFAELESKLDRLIAALGTDFIDIDDSANLPGGSQ